MLSSFNNCGLEQAAVTASVTQQNMTPGYASIAVDTAAKQSNPVGQLYVPAAAGYTSQQTKAICRQILSTTTSPDLFWLEQVDVVDSVPSDVCHHVQEQIVSLQLILHQGIPLCIPSQAHSLNMPSKDISKHTQHSQHLQPMTHPD